MDFNDLGLSKFNNIHDEWAKRFASYGPDVVSSASKYRNNKHCIPIGIAGGSFNFCVQVLFDDSTEWMLRFPIPGRVMHPEGKTRQEVATMRFVKENTSIPVRAIVTYGMGEDNPMGLGPFIIMEFDGEAPSSSSAAAKVGSRPLSVRLNEMERCGSLNLDGKSTVECIELRLKSLTLLL